MPKPVFYSFFSIISTNIFSRRVNKQEIENKMSLHNLAMVFGPTLLRPGKPSSSSVKQQKDYLESSTVDVMAQAGILYCFLLSKLA